MLSLRARSIAIIGAGPSGLAAAKYLRAEKAFDKIVIFEQRSSSGGIWNYTPDDRDEELFKVPRTDPKAKNQNPIWRESRQPSTKSLGVNEQDCVTKRVSFLSPIYERLETNIPRGLMGFQDLDWPADSQLFPKHETVLSYITEYGKDVQNLIQYETQVTNVSPTDSSPTGSWRIKTRKLRSNEENEEEFDALVVANGHFIVPYVPDILAIKEWNEKFPGAISHSKYFRRPEDFSGKKVVVVGNSASGLDISSQIVAYAKLPILWSSRSPSRFSPAADPRKREHPPIKRFLPENGGVEFEDGVIETDIDAVVFATGYFYSFPFLEDVKPELITDGTHVQHTYKHLFYAPRPTLSFMVLNQRIIPFPVAESQAGVLARVYSGRLALPTYEEMRRWEEKTIEEMGDGGDFHLLPFPKDGYFINEMSNWAITAPLREGLENNGKGMIPPAWGEWEFWCREKFPTIRSVFGERGEERHGIRSLEELGFVYEERVKEVNGSGEKIL
ncbi:flavin-containing monooxygenase [Lojkania enalia]|uniref:Flavin-containing monooxygenase n=1 Tax=Lojkania enalia TaxID=147567 RepID=A0A9P4K4D4_9PLEO|nr:flavin-containing monooxygenase [Didymosphaeria enalia]